ncbi:MAG: helix-turn-helix transcriptional regulator [bacterium]
MKTAGQLLQEKRLLKELTIEEIAANIKVKPKYLTALENSDFASLPSSTFIKGFLRNYASALKVNPETVLAMFRRDFVENEQGEIIPKGLVKPVSNKPKVFSALSFLIGLTLLFFLGFLGYQLIGWWSLPKLDILQPINGEVYGELVTIKGKTDHDASLSINNQKVIVNQSGEFSLDLLFPAGTHSVIITTTNRQGKSKMEERSFQVSK